MRRWHEDEDRPRGQLLLDLKVYYCPCCKPVWPEAGVLAEDAAGNMRWWHSWCRRAEHMEQAKKAARRG